MSFGKVPDFVNILSNNKNVQGTLNTRVLTLLPLKLFRLLRGFFWPLLLTPEKYIRPWTTSIQCYVTNCEAKNELYFQRNKCNIFDNLIIEVYGGGGWDWSKIDWYIYMFFLRHSLKELLGKLPFIGFVWPKFQCLKWYITIYWVSFKNTSKLSSRINEFQRTLSAHLRLFPCLSTET